MSDYVIRQGQRIAVKTLELGATPKNRTLGLNRKPVGKGGRQHGDWGYVNSIRWFIAAREVLRGCECGALAVVVYLEREYGMGHRAAKLTNQALAAWGVSSDQKIRTIRTLERAGLVSVIWGGRSSPIVTIRRRKRRRICRTHAADRRRNADESAEPTRRRRR
jgi:hypothetical protein